jgi:hypothetical protein
MVFGVTENKNQIENNRFLNPNLLILCRIHKSSKELQILILITEAEIIN